MKNYLALLLVLSFSLHIWGDLLVFQLHRYQIRREMRREIAAGLPSQELSKLYVSNTKLRKLGWDKVDEFKFEGAWYDVVELQSEGDHYTIIYCIKDADETQLYAHYAQHFKDSKNPKKHRSSTAKLSFKYVHRDENFKSRQDLFLALQKAKIPVLKTSLYDSPKLEITSPPPQYIA